MRAEPGNEANWEVKKERHSQSRSQAPLPTSLVPTFPGQLVSFPGFILTVEAVNNGD